jgi:putative ABC transport system substrate-binding protein
MRRVNVKLTRFDVSDPDFERVMTKMVTARMSAVIVPNDRHFIDHRQVIVDLALKNSLPVAAGSSPFVEAGALMSYGPAQAELVRLQARYVDRILRGTKAGDMRQPTTFELVINLKTAKTLGLTIPPSLLLRADRVID